MGIFRDFVYFPVTLTFDRCERNFGVDYCGLVLLLHKNYKAIRTILTNLKIGVNDDVIQTRVAQKLTSRLCIGYYPYHAQ
jgi:hypothetical protein